MYTFYSARQALIRGSANDELRFGTEAKLQCQRTSTQREREMDRRRFLKNLAATAAGVG